MRALNEEAGLPILLDGLRAQRERNFEVVLVDSGSTDRTRQIARAERDVPVRLVDIDRFTYGRALNVGLAAARGRYVAFLSAHVQLLSDDWLGEMQRACSRPGVAGAFSRQVAWSSSPCYERLFVWWMYGRNMRLPGLASFSFTNAATMIRRECWSSRPFDETLPACEDYDWAMGALRDGFRLVWVPQVGVRHSHHESFAGSCAAAGARAARSRRSSAATSAAVGEVARRPLAPTCWSRSSTTGGPPTR